MTSNTAQSRIIVNKILASYNITNLSLLGNYNKKQYLPST